MSLVSAAHGHTIIFTMDENVVFSYSFPFPHSAEGAEEGAGFPGPEGSLGFTYALCPRALKHCSSQVEMSGREIPGDITPSGIMFQCGFVHL